VSEFSGHSVVA